MVTCLEFYLLKGVRTISKNILIMGEQRCGKSSVTNYILEKYNNYEAMRGDALAIALSSTLTEMHLDEYENKENKRERS